MSGHVHGTGVEQQVSTEQQLAQRRRFDAAYAKAVREHRHLWIATFAYYVNPPLRDGHMFDTENMATGPAVGCYVCERAWEEQPPLRCTGEPK